MSSQRITPSVGGQGSTTRIEIFWVKCRPTMAKKRVRSLRDLSTGKALG